MRPPTIAPMEWDSSFFGKRIGRLLPDPDSSTDLDAVSHLDRSSFDCVFVELDVDAAHLLHRWSSLGARLVDVRLELSAPVKSLVAHTPSRSIEVIEEWSSDDRNAAIELAEDLSAWSRFARDPAFADSAARMYRKWIGMAFSGAHEALVWREQGRIAGILTSRLEPDAAWLELLDVNEGHRGRGIGLALVNAFLARAGTTARPVARVRTQLRNAGALRTYERAGFGLSRATLVLHWWPRS